MYFYNISGGTYDVSYDKYYVSSTKYTNEELLDIVKKCHKQTRLNNIKNKPNNHVCRNIKYLDVEYTVFNKFSSFDKELAKYDLISVNNNVAAKVDIGISPTINENTEYIEKNFDDSDTYDLGMDLECYNNCYRNIMGRFNLCPYLFDECEENVKKRYGVNIIRPNIYVKEMVYFLDGRVIRFINNRFLHSLCIMSENGKLINKNVEEYIVDYWKFKKLFEKYRGDYSEEEVERVEMILEGCLWDEFKYVAEVCVDDNESV